MKGFRRRREDVAAGGSEPAPPSALALVLTSGHVELSPIGLEDSWRRLWPGRPGLSGPALEGGAIAATLDRGTVAVSAVASPVPAGDLEPLVGRSPLWPDPREAVAAHDGHAVVFATGETPLAACLAATHLTCAVLDAVGGLGVYWGAAPHLVRGDVFRELASSGTDTEPPVLLWVRIAATTEADGTASARTTGMGQLGVMEVEALHAGMPAEELHRIVTGVVEYLAVNGPVIADGDTIGGTRAERIAVSHRESGLEPDEQVYALLVG